MPVTGKMPVPQVSPLKWKHYIYPFDTWIVVTSPTQYKSLTLNNYRDFGVQELA
jgi:hypothetical protein